jgi:hypothetical protein
MGEESPMLIECPGESQSTGRRSGKRPDCLPGVCPSAELTLHVLGEIFPQIFRYRNPSHPSLHYLTELLKSQVLYRLVLRGQKLEGGVYRIDI